MDEFQVLSPDDERLGPGNKAVWEMFYQYAESNNMSPHAALALQGILESSGLFSEVNVRKVAVNMSKKGDPRIGEFVHHRSMDWCYLS